MQEASIDTSGDQPTVTGLWSSGADGVIRRVRARMVIAADGGTRAWGARSGSRGPRRIPGAGPSAPTFRTSRISGTFGEMHVRRNRYIGVAPLPDGLANACVVAPRMPGSSPASFLLTSLASDPLLRGRFAAARMVGDVVSLGPLGVDCPGAGAPGLLLAGDAAGFVDPMTGDGLRFAFRGGELAALEALGALSSGRVEDAHVHLAQARAAEFASKWRFNRTLRLLVAYPRRGACRRLRRDTRAAGAATRHPIRWRRPRGMIFR